LWQRVSLWRFGWRYAFDKLPLTDGAKTDREWQRFLDEEALPIVQRHSEAFVAIVREVIGEVARNDHVQQAARDSLATVLKDPDFERVARTMFQETVLRNDHFRAVMRRQWSGPEMQQAIELASSRLEPAIRHMTDILIGSPDEGITEEFAQVLRSQILAKDRRWFLLEAPPQAAGAPRADAVQVQGASDHGR
jgi:hypothetical protein